MKVGDLVQVTRGHDYGRVLLLLEDKGYHSYSNGAGNVYLGQPINSPHVLEYHVFEKDAEVISGNR
jgi:hypothetical protein